jgi:hypothetical protein
MRRLILILSITCFVAALAVVAHNRAPARNTAAAHATVHPAMLDIIRCSPPSHPDGRFQNTVYAPEWIVPGRKFDGLLLRTDIYDPSDCGRVITEARNRAIIHLNQARNG